MNYQPCGWSLSAATLAASALAVLSMLSFGCGSQQPAPDQAQQTQGGGGGQNRGGGRGRGAAVPVAVGKATLKNMPIEVTAIGTVEAYLSVAVRAQVSGILLEARFKEGDLVHQGQVLFKIDPQPYDASLAQAKAALARDKALAANNRSQADRYKKLLDEGVVPAQQVDQALSAADASDATVNADEAAIQQAQLNLDYCTISSPLEGYTGKLQIQPGNLVNTNTASLVVVNQVSPIYVTFSVPQQNLGDIKKYMSQGKLTVTATVPNDPGPPELGILTFVDNAVDPSTGTIRLRADFANPRDRLWPGLFVNTTLRLSERPNAVVVPSQAISNNQSGQYVYVVKDDGTVESRPIVAGSSTEGLTIVQQGLKPGEVVVTDGQLRLVPGGRVEITNREADAASASSVPSAAAAGGAKNDPAVGQK